MTSRSKYSNYYLLYQNLTDILFGGAVTVRNMPNIAATEKYVGQIVQHHFKKELYVHVHFGMAKMCVADIDLQIYLYPDGFREGTTCITLTEDPNRGNIRIQPQENGDAEFFVALFDIPEEYQYLPRKNQYYRAAEILILCRCKDGSHIFPIDDYDSVLRKRTSRYIGIRQKLYEKVTINTNVRSNPYTQAHNEQEEAERQQNLICVRTSSRDLKREPKAKLMSPNFWNND